MEQQSRQQRPAQAGDFETHTVGTGAVLAELTVALAACNARLLARMHTDSGDDLAAYSAACAAIAHARSLSS